MNSFIGPLVWIISLVCIACIILRPRGWPEAVWACLGAAALVIFRLIPLSRAFSAIGKGTDVYLFLTGMMLLSELARQKGVFDWLAGIAISHAKGSPARLFALVYGVGILVTVFLSNDATAVVLTPAVYAAVRKARAEPLPYLFACAMIANAASFVLPISNPANLVIYASTLPPLLPWLRTFLLPSVVSIVVTFIALRLLSRRELGGDVYDSVTGAKLSPEGHRAAWGIAATGAILLAASAFGRDLGLPTCLSALGALFIATRARLSEVRRVLRDVSWAVLPLVAALFVLVEGLDAAGALRQLGILLRQLAAWTPAAGSLAASFGIAALSNVMNNLPSGLLAGSALKTFPVPAYLRNAILIGVDLGPNLSVTGSLATLLWLIALRREGQHVSGWTFLKRGACIMPPALLLATLAILLTQR